MYFHHIIGCKITKILVKLRIFVVFLQVSSKKIKILVNLQIINKLILLKPG